MVDIVWYMSLLWLWVAVMALVLQGGKLGTLFAFLHQELWIVGPGVVLALPWNSAQPDTTAADRLLMTVLTAEHLWLWWSLRNWPDENKWTRRGRRLKEKVAARGGKLVVEPATT